MRGKKASGLDEIPSRLLKECAPYISAPLRHIFNMSLETATFPTVWKKGLIQPVFKNNGKSTAPQYYRPIALLSFVSKVFESFVREQLLPFCMDTGAIPDEQFGFLPKRSTVWQLYLQSRMNGSKH